MSRPVFLFDVDGVLVIPAGYRQASQAAINFFTRQMGIEDQLLDENIFALFESNNIISEWDIVPLCLAAILDDLQSRCADLRLPPDLSGSLAGLCDYKLPAPQVDYKNLASNLGARFLPGQTFADQALQYSQTTAANSPFPHLQGQPLLPVILADTRDVFKNPVIRIFQEFVLGSQNFQKAYGLTGEVETGSFLTLYDRPALEAGCRDELLQLWDAGRLDLAAYTIRPSLLGSEPPAKMLAYSPEAELALQINGLEAMPIMGYGQVYRAAELAGIRPDEILKPSPVQALAAMAAAVFRDGLRAMSAAMDWSGRGKTAYFERLPALDIHIFEDSAGSILGVRAGAERLMSLGIPVTLNAWGVASSPVKIAALQAAQAEVFPDVNRAVQEALSHLS
ncbi:MAG: hypothetical protein P4L50_08185 [Anaerolineaceae bacterium]|nr:hypothetical protein [Anaerolineaceae bacterium]